MMRFLLSHMAAITGGRLSGADAEVRGMIHDARQVVAGNLFCALPGTRHDGHEFVAQARAAGAAAALVAQPVDDGLPQLVVADVARAMGDIARAWRRSLNVKVIGVTGSNGKTTVKEMLAAVLGRGAEVLATEGNYNNELGVPLTLARLNEKHRHAVVEMGASKPGDIAWLADIARPDIGLVTNAAPAHLQGFASVEGVARAKGELFEALPDSGTAIINADDEHAPLWRRMAGERRTVTFGLASGASVSGILMRGVARMHTPAGDLEFNAALPGRHNFCNALAAAAAAVALDTPVEEIAAGLASIHSLPGRLRVLAHAGGGRVIDDSYNANPGSLAAALSVLAETPSDERWLVLGDMGELGSDDEQLHADAGRTAREHGVDRLFGLGPLTKASVTAFGPGGRHFDDVDALVGVLKQKFGSGVTVLIKGSRSMGMERVVERLLPGEIAC